MTVSNKKLQGEINLLQKQLEEKSVVTAESNDARFRVSEIEKKLTEEKRTTASLTQQLTDMECELLKARDTSEKDSQIKSLKERVTTLTDELKTMQESVSGVSASANNKVALMQAEVDKYRQKYQGITDLLREKEDQIAEMDSSIFSMMGNSVAPRGAMHLALPIAQSPFKNMYVFAAGSAESMMPLYNLVAKQVAQMPTKRFLVVDLVIDSYVDQALGVKGALKTPIDWMSGAKPINGFISPAKYNNVGVVSVATSYINELFMLNVDWSKRLSELSRLADVVIINVGNIESIVHKILFSTFSAVMRGHIIVKATPINLRTVILQLSGLGSLQNTTVDCVDFAQGVSQSFYQRLASKFQSQILSDKDIIPM